MSASGPAVRRLWGRRGLRYSDPSTVTRDSGDRAEIPRPLSRLAIATDDPLQSHGGMGRRRSIRAGRARLFRLSSAASRALISSEWPQAFGARRTDAFRLCRRSRRVSSSLTAREVRTSSPKTGNCPRRPAGRRRKPGARGADPCRGRRQFHRAGQGDRRDVQGEDRRRRGVELRRVGRISIADHARARRSRCSSPPTPSGRRQAVDAGLAAPAAASPTRSASSCCGARASTSPRATRR